MNIERLLSLLADEEQFSSAGDTLSKLISTTLAWASLQDELTDEEMEQLAAAGRTGTHIQRGIIQEGYHQLLDQCCHEGPGLRFSQCPQLLMYTLHPTYTT